MVERIEFRTADDPALADPTRFAARVEVTAGETTCEATILAATGEPARPVGDEALIGTFRSLADPAVGSAAAQKIAAAAFSLGEGGGNGQLMHLLNGTA